MDRKREPTVRPASRADVGSLLRLVGEYWDFEGIEGFDEARVGEQLEWLLGDPRLGAVWLATDADMPAGYLLAVYVFSLEHLGLTVEIDEFFIRPGFRGGGTGARMLRTAEEAFRAAGCTSVSLEVGRGNDAGRRFWLSQGYAARANFELLDKML
ncbi:MAG TPA: GNAT family N-acetyltransferase [Woeseiaceae bacterium]